MLDTIESLFGGFDNQAVLRSELRRLFRFLKDRGVTAVITGERGEGSLTRQGLEEYVSDCVILLDHRVTEQTSTRRMRIVKYRGTTHGTNEYPFLIDADGFSVLPLSGLQLDHAVSNERVSSGVPALDEMLDGKGYYRGSSILVSGTAGTGKTSLAAHFAQETARRGERCLYLAFEESPQQLMRNMRSIGVDLEPHVKKGTLRLHSSRPTLHGLEMHLVQVHKMVSRVQAGGGGHRPDQQFHQQLDRDRDPGDAAAAGRLPEGEADHRVVHAPHQRRQRHGGHRRRHLVADRHLAAGAQHRDRQRAHARPLRAQVARHAALARDPRIRPHPQGNPAQDKSPAKPERASRRR